MALFDIFGTLGKYASTIGHVVDAYSAIQSYTAENKAAREAEKANAAMMKAAQTEAALTKQDAAIRAEAARRDAQRFRARQISTYLKSGVTLDGSPSLVTDETAAYGKQDAQNILTNADYSARSIFLRAEANKRSVNRGDIFGTGVSLLGSLGKAKNAYDKAQKGG